MPDDDRDWRQTVAAQLGKLADTQAQTAVTLERINGRLDTLDDWRREQRQEQRGAPERQAVQSATLAQWVIAGIAITALLLSLVGHVYLR